jgi:hypothetical protein
MNTTVDSTSPVCPYCGGASELVGGDRIYPRRPDLHAKRFYLCAPCDAYVGCHNGTTNPLGRLADRRLRAAKIRAHEAFDPLWKSNVMTRAEAYAWLAKTLGIPPEKCHVGVFDVETCERVVDVCGDFLF